LPMRNAGPTMLTKGAATSRSKPPIVCSGLLGSGFSETFTSKAWAAQKRLTNLERRQEEMLLTVGELRKQLLGNCGSVCCPKGHLLLPLGTSLYPVGSAEYKHWSCDAAHEAGACRNGPSAGSHLTTLRRYHCATCRYDLCEVCYQHRLWGGEPPPKQAAFALKPPLPSQGVFSLKAPADAPPFLTQPIFDAPRLPPAGNRV